MSGVDLAEFLRQRLKITLSSEARLRLSHQSTSECFVSLEQARQIELLAHEVVANAIMHAHPSGIDVEVTLECGRLPDGRVVVGITDDGVGLPEDMNPYRDGGAGFQKIRAVAATLGADLCIESDSLGSKFTLTVPATAQHEFAHGDAYFRKILDELRPQSMPPIPKAGLATLTKLPPHCGDAARRSGKPDGAEPRSSFGPMAVNCRWPKVRWRLR
jgi:anti-sigma regulatory factor (Ser/Thr protein kinase)